MYSTLQIDSVVLWKFVFLQMSLYTVEALPVSNEYFWESMISLAAAEAAL